MHTMIINSAEVLRILKAFQTFATYERNKRLSNSHFSMPIWEDKVSFNVVADELMAWLVYDTGDYQLSCSIHCDSKEDVRFYLNINDLLCLLENAEDKSILMREFYSDCSVIDIMSDLRAMKATSGHNNFGYDFILLESKNSIGRLNAYFVKDSFRMIKTKIGEKEIGQYRQFQGNLLASTLYEFDGFTSLYGEIQQELSIIWYNIDGNRCSVKATNSHMLKLKDYELNENYNPGTFGVIGELAKPIIEFIKNKNVYIIYGEHFCCLIVDGIFLEMPYDKVKKLPSFDKALEKFAPKEQLTIKKSSLEKFIEFVDLTMPSQHFVDIHFDGKYTYLQCLSEEHLSEYIGDVIENDVIVEDIRLRLSIQSLKSILKNCNSKLIRFSIDTSKNQLCNIADLSEPFSKAKAQLIIGAVFDNNLLELEANEGLMRMERGIESSPKDDSSLESFVLGQKFTRHKIIYDGENKVVPVITSKGIDVILALTNISVEEYYALNEAPLVLAVFEINSVPFIILDFDKTMIYQFGLNIMGMSEPDRKIWLDNSDINVLRLFHVDADTGELLSMRMHHIQIMEHIKNICKSQIKYDAEKINNFIIQTENVMTVQEMYEYAQQSEILKIDVML